VSSSLPFATWTLVYRTGAALPFAAAMRPTCFWTVSRLIPVVSEMKTGWEEKKSSGELMPAAKYFFMLAAGIPACFRNRSFSTIFASWRIESASLSAIPTLFRSAGSAVPSEAMSLIPASWSFLITLAGLLPFRGMSILRMSFRQSDRRLSSPRTSSASRTRSQAFSLLIWRSEASGVGSRPARSVTV